MKKIILIISLIINCTFFAQTGPGGVGINDGTSNLVLWLDANTITGTDGSTITTWTDQSGYGYNFANGNGAVFNNTIVNNYPAFTFNGTSNYFEKPFETKLNPNNFSVFAVDNITSSGNYKAVFSNRDDTAGPATAGFILYSKPSTNKWHYWIGDTTGWVTTGDNTSTAGNWAEQMVSYNGSTNEKKLLINGNVDATNTHSISYNTQRPFRIGAGANESAANYLYKGNISEIVMYDKVLSNAEQIIVSNYLSAKYNYTLTSHDFYTQDDFGNGNFDHNVAGIGQAIDGTNHTDSQGTGIVQINTPSTLSNGDYLFWGEETRNPIYTTTSTSNYLEHLDRKWRVSKVTNLGTVSVSISTDDLVLSGMQTCASVKLVVSNTANFTTKTTYNMTLLGGIHTATAVNFTDGDYFTFEYSNEIVIDNTKFYNGSGTLEVPNTNDSCLKLLVKATANGNLSLTENAHIKEIEVETGGVLVVDNGVTLTVTGGIILNGEIRLLGSAQLVQTHTGTSQITGNGKLYVDVKSGLTSIYQSSYFSSPVTSIGINTYAISDVMKDGTSPLTKNSTITNINFITGHDGTVGPPISVSNFWINKLINDIEWADSGIGGTTVTESTSFNPAEGYNMKSTGANTQNYTFIGKPNDGDYSIAVNAGKSSLIGNPYPSTIDADLFLTDNGALFNNTLYFWDGKTDASATHIRADYTNSYATYVSGVGTSINSGSIPTNNIAIGQAFFVDTTVNGNITFNNSQRKSGSNTPFFSRANPFPILRLGFEFVVNQSVNQTFKRQLAIGFRGLTNDYDSGYDATMAVYQPTDISLKVNNHNSEFVITGIENYNEDIEIPLHIRVNEQRDISFNIDAIENFNPNNIFLKDNITNMYYDLTNPITINLPAGNYTDRFSITFINNIANTKDYITNNAITIIDDIDTLTFINKENSAIKKIAIYNIVGQLLDYKIGNNKTIRFLTHINNGQVLIAKITLENNQTIVKKLIKK